MYYINVNNVSNDSINCGISISSTSIIGVSSVTSRDSSNVTSSVNTTTTTRDHYHRMRLTVGRRNPCDHDHRCSRPPNDNDDDDDDDGSDDEDDGSDDDDTSSLLLVS